MKRIILILFLITLNVLKSNAQDITFSHLTTDEGLSQFTVNALHRDEKGFIWIATREGLNRYNGNDIKTYKLQKNNPNSLFCNTVLRITGNNNGKIYLLCTEGVSELDREQERFTTLLQGDITAIHYNKRLYIGTKNEIFTYNEETHNFDLYYKIAGKDLRISALFVDNSGVLWVGTANHGTYALHNKELRHWIEKGNVNGIYQDSKNDLWIGTWEHGLFRYTNGKFLNYLNDPKDESSISSNFVRACCEDNQGNIWIGTFSGLEKFNKQTGKFNHYQANDTRGGLSHSSIWSIIKDHQGTLWMGTYFGGVNYFNPEYEIYTRYNISSVESKGLSSSIVGRMIEDDKNNLWICTEGGGVNVFNRKENTFKWYKHDNSKNSISHNNVKAIYFDSDKQIMWIGTHTGGLNKLELKTDRFTHYQAIDGDSTSFPSGIIRDIVPYQDQLIVATQEGVCMFNPLSGKCRQLFKDTEKGRSIKMVADLLFDHKGTLWIAVTGEGVFSYRFDTNKLVNYQHKPNDTNSISNNNVNSIQQDCTGNLWFSTSGSGLDLYTYKTNSFENFDSQKNGLSSDCVYEVRESRHGKLLVITNQGFSQFDYANKTFYNYSVDNGFPLTAINENALYLTHDGEVFLGGIRGMVSFHEKDLNFSRKPYNITFNRLFVNGKEINVGDDSGILKTSLNNSKQITLHSKHSFFSIEFATSNYLLANKDEIEYKLEGFSQEWNNVRDQHIITYTNLDAGNYTLVIRSADPDNGGKPEAKINIKILPPFYKTVYAYCLYIIIITIILFYLIKTYNAKIKLQESLKYEKKHNHDIEMLNQSKLRFFTNISHEFRTPLTLIIGHVEMLLQVQSFTPTIYNKVLGIYKNSIQLRELITELLDFRKQEQGHMKVKVSEHNIIDFLYENFLLFLEYASTKQINFKFIKGTDTLNVWYDSKQMQKVVNNLLSNAFKHTKEEDTITIQVDRTENEAIIKVNDSGTGIAPEDIEKVFDRFYQTEKMDSLTATGTGIGLALTKGIVELHHGSIEVDSEIGKGTTFIIKLKLGNSHFTIEQLSEKKNETDEHLEINKQETELALEEQNVIEEPINNKTRGMKMLIVEDNESLKEMLIRIFETFYEIITASDGEEGLEKTRAEKPDIILSDIMMPKMSGTDMCKIIKSDFETCHIPVVLLTARTAIEHTLEGLRIGADDYITKPFNINILISRCNNLVNSRIVLQEKFSKQPQITPQMLATNAIDKELLDRAMAIIEKNLDNTEFNINIFAREMGIARTNLFAKIKAITGQTPNDFISTMRLKKAAYMLRNNLELNISEISDQTGFSSSRYFSKCFKDIYHVSPLSYRKGLDNDEEEEKEA